MHPIEAVRVLLLATQNPDVQQSKMQGQHESVCVQARVKFHVLLTTYEMVGSETGTLGSLEYETLIVDEGHRCDLFPFWLCSAPQALSSFC